MVYKKKDKTDDNIQYEVLEELTIYTLKSRQEHEIIVEKLNKQLGYEGFSVENVLYPYTFIVDAHEMINMMEKHQKKVS